MFNKNNEVRLNAKRLDKYYIISFHVNCAAIQVFKNICECFFYITKETKKYTACVQFKWYYGFIKWNYITHSLPYTIWT